MTKVLESYTAFKEKYSYNPIISKAIRSSIFGIGSSAAVIGSSVASAGSAAAAGATAVAATTGVAGVASHFVSWPLIGGIANGIVASAASGAATSGAVAAAAGTAAIGALPVALAAGAAVAGGTILIQRKKRAPYQKGSGLENLAKTVGQIIFLPLLAKCKKMIENGSISKTDPIGEAIKAAQSRITEWGYTREYVCNLVHEAFGRSSDELLKEFDSILEKLNGLKKNELYNGIPKYELPPKGIQRIAQELANSVNS